MLDVLDAAIADAETRPQSRWPWRRGRAVILRLTAPKLLGHTGIASGLDELSRPIYGYTLDQCREVRAAILRAARDDYQATQAAP